MLFFYVSISSVFDYRFHFIFQFFQKQKQAKEALGSSSSRTQRDIDSRGDNWRVAWARRMEKRNQTQRTTGLFRRWAEYTRYQRKKSRGVEDKPETGVSIMAANRERRRLLRICFCSWAVYCGADEDLKASWENDLTMSLLLRAKPGGPPALDRQAEFHLYKRQAEELENQLKELREVRGRSASGAIELMMGRLQRVFEKQAREIMRVQQSVQDGHDNLRNKQDQFDAFRKRQQAAIDKARIMALSSQQKFSDNSTVINTFAKWKVYVHLTKVQRFMNRQKARDHFVVDRLETFHGQVDRLRTRNLSQRVFRAWRDDIWRKNTMVHAFRARELDYKRTKVSMALAFMAWKRDVVDRGSLRHRQNLAGGSRYKVVFAILRMTFTSWKRYTQRLGPDLPQDQLKWHENPMAFANQVHPGQAFPHQFVPPMEAQGIVNHALGPGVNVIPGYHGQMAVDPSMVNVGLGPGFGPGQGGGPGFGPGQGGGPGLGPGLGGGAVPAVMVTGTQGDSHTLSPGQEGSGSKKKSKRGDDDFIERAPPGPKFAANPEVSVRQEQPKFGDASYMPGGYPRVEGERSVDDVLAMDLNGPVATIGRTGKDGDDEPHLSAQARTRQAMIAKGEAMARLKAEQNDYTPSPKYKDSDIQAMQRQQQIEQQIAARQQQQPRATGSTQRARNDSLKSEITVDDLKKPSKKPPLRAMSSDSDSSLSSASHSDNKDSSKPGRFHMTPSPGASPVKGDGKGKPPAPTSNLLIPKSAAPSRNDARRGSTFAHFGSDDEEEDPIHKLGKLRGGRLDVSTQMRSGQGALIDMQGNKFSDSSDSDSNASSSLPMPAPKPPAARAGTMNQSRRQAGVHLHHHVIKSKFRNRLNVYKIA